MKICLISSVNMGMVDGSTVRPLNISENLAEFGCEIMHICIESPEPKENITYILKYNKGKDANKLKKLICIFGWYKEVKRFSPDVIYAHQIFNATIAVPLRYLLRKPLIYEEHGSFALETKVKKKNLLWENLVLKMTDKAIVVTDDVKNIFVETHGAPREKIKVIRDGANTNLFIPKEKDNILKERYGLANKDKVVIFVCPRGLPANDLALEYFFNLVPKIEGKIENNIKYLIIGGGSQPTPPSSNIIYTGFVDDLVSHINLGDVCVAPYPPSAKYGTAGAKNKIIEYFACGKPVISTEEGVRGFDDAVPTKDFLLASDSDDFVDKLISVLFDVDLSKKLGENARNFSLKYDWRDLSKEVLNVLESVIQ